MLNSVQYFKLIATHSQLNESIHDCSISYSCQFNMWCCIKLNCQFEVITELPQIVKPGPFCWETAQMHKVSCEDNASSSHFRHISFIHLEHHWTCSIRQTSWFQHKAKFSNPNPWYCVVNIHHSLMMQSFAPSFGRHKKCRRCIDYFILLGGIITVGS